MDKPENIINHLSELVNAARRERLKTILKQRTRHLSVVLEDPCRSQNASAVVRTCECLGIQEIHIIENQHACQLNPAITKGASKWIELHRYKEEHKDNTTVCINGLREKGYRIIAMTPGQNNKPLEAIGIEKKLALCFGSEAAGLSETLFGLADAAATIPVYGFTQSYNLSVSVAISLYGLISRLKHGKVSWPLDKTDMSRLYIQWLAKSTPAGHTLLKKYRQDPADE